MKIYADNAATTRVSDTALAAMTPCFQEIYGNPSSLYRFGQEAKADLEGKCATVTLAAPVSDQELKDAVTEAGYEVVSIQ